ncbi:DUF3862 domain-containing protein [Alteromonadaceae bacterium BrNp21-10]|nr:DUF3862 domain-containing protein [Alteromonadaceae bacterium BrNp21-10]
MKKLLFSLTFLTLTACSPLTTENYDKLEVGMDYNEVIAILGAPDQCKEALGTNGCVWGNEQNKFIKVSFIAEKAVFFEKEKLSN